MESGMRTVLVVDDSPTNLTATAGVFEKFGIKAICVTNGLDAVGLIERGKPAFDAVFMDYMMPGMDGLEAFRRIRALGNDYAASIPVIALTGNEDGGVERRLLEEGFAAYIAKPVGVDKVEAIVREWIGG
jgi:CheY-like chemotaxis protein